MSDFRRYVSFEASDEDSRMLRSRNIDPDMIRLKGPEKKLVERALEEIAQTPEGIALLKEAASRFPDGKIRIMSGTPLNEETKAVHGGILISGKTADARYFSPETGRYHDFSIQNTLVHELYHHAHAHEAFSLENEAEAIRSTNEYMRKYYGEPIRDETYTATDNNGTKEWDFNEGFYLGIDGIEPEIITPENLRGRIAKIPAAQIQVLSPETQSLYEVRDIPALFGRQYEEIKAGGGLSYVAGDLPENPPAPQPESPSPQDAPQSIAFSGMNAPKLF